MNYLERLAAEIERRVPEDRLPDGDTRQLFLMYAVLARAKGDAVAAEDVHDAWTAWMTLSDAGHDALVEYDRLDAETRGEDDVFLEAIRAAVGNETADH
jgi:hypothetical protein